MAVQGPEFCCSALEFTLIITEFGFKSCRVLPPCEKFDPYHWRVCVLACWIRLRRARRREVVLTVEVVGSSVEACVAFVFGFVAVVAEKQVRMS
jgi:hypothetical protein